MATARKKKAAKKAAKKTAKKAAAPQVRLRTDDEVAELMSRLALAIPTPSASTRGTVTGPVVTAPASHASPKTGARSGFCER